MAEKGRGAELSDLCVFNGKLYTVGDRTGIGMWQQADTYVFVSGFVSGSFPAALSQLVAIASVVCACMSL